MNKIVVPMDFTKASYNALKYAINLFGKGAEFTVVHVSDGLLELDDNINLSLLETKAEALEKQMKNQITEVLGVDTMPKNIHIEIKVGNVVSSIVNWLNKTPFNAMVLGTRDKYDMFDRWFGTISLGLVKRLNIPVYLVPIYSHFEGYNKVMVASDYKIKDTKAIVNIARWNKNHNAAIKFLHIHHETDDDYDAEKEEILRGLFKNEDPKFSFEVDVTSGSNVTETLLGQAYNYHADLLIVFPENHSLFHTLMFKNTSKELILKSNIPILFASKDSVINLIPNHKEWHSTT